MSNEKHEATFHGASEGAPGGESGPEDGKAAVARVVRDIRDFLPGEVAARMDRLVERYESRLARQKGIINSLMAEREARQGVNKALIEKVHELEAEIKDRDRAAQGRGSW